jgi:hypothetical protein
MNWILFWRLIQLMLTEEFKKYFRYTYTTDAFSYTAKAYEEIINWNGWNPNTEVKFKEIIKNIKNGKGEEDKNPDIENGKYMSEIINGKEYMTVYFQLLEDYTETVYFIHDFIIGRCPNL